MAKQRTSSKVTNRLQLPEEMKRWLPAVVLVAVVCAVYGGAVATPFAFDDEASVLENQSIVRLWPLVGDVQRPGPLNPPTDFPTAGRPLVNFTLALNYQFGGLSPAGYHVFNLIVHALATLLLMAIVRRTLRLEYFGGRFEGVAEWLAFAVALLWAVHPLQTETVVYITQRTELMVGFFYLATLYCSLRYWTAAIAGDRTQWLVLAALACAAGMACKEVMVTAPLVVLLFERTFISGSFRQALRKSWPLYAALALGWLLLAGLNWSAPRSESAGFHLGVSMTEWWLTQTKVLWMYLKLTVWPWPLAIHYAMPYLNTVGAAWPWLAPTALLIGGTLVLLWRRNAIGFVGAWVLLILSPTLVIPIITEVAAERRMYLPLAGLVSLAVVGGYQLARISAGSFERDRKRMTERQSPGMFSIAVVLILALVLGAVSVRRLEAYHDAITLLTDAAISQPADYLIHYNLGNALIQAGRPAEAIGHYEQSLRLKPEYFEALTNMGIALATVGQSEKAIECFQQALRAKPDYAEAENNLGLTLLSMGRIQEAQEHLEKALRTKPGYAEAHLNLGNVMLATGKKQEAIAHFEQALQLKPDYAEAYYNLGTTFGGQGQFEKAIECFRNAVRIKPDYVQAQNNLGVALYHLGRVQEAIEHYERALAVRPEYPDAHENIAKALAAVGRGQEAVAHFQQALRQRPDHAAAWMDLATEYAAMSQTSEAMIAARKALELARSQGQTALAEQIDGWLQQHRADSSKTP